MDYKNLNNGVFEHMMKNALIERYRDEVRDLRASEGEEVNFAEMLKREIEKNGLRPEKKIQTVEKKNSFDGFR